MRAWPSRPVPQARVFRSELLPVAEQVRRHERLRRQAAEEFKTETHQDILIAVTDGLKGMSEAFVIYPQTRCRRHRAPDSAQSRLPNWKEQKPMAIALRPIYAAANAEAASHTDWSEKEEEPLR